MVEVQLVLLFVFAMAWVVLYEIFDRRIYCALAWVSWWVLSAFWIYSTSLYMPLAYLPLGVGWIYLIRLVIDIFDMARRRRWE